jgi:hypothetical protein
MSLIHNERTKLFANALNTAATSSFAIGVLAPMAAAFYNFGGTSPLRFGNLVVGTVIWLSAAIVLHLGARRVLRDLRE